ncbi:MAG: hypothetical protein ACK5PB_05630 [Pirellula sp.]
MAGICVGRNKARRSYGRGILQLNPKPTSHSALACCAVTESHFVLLRPTGAPDGGEVGQDVGINGGRDDLLGEQATVVIGHGGDHAHAVFGLDHTACISTCAIERLLSGAIGISCCYDSFGIIVGIGGCLSERIGRRDKQPGRVVGVGGFGARLAWAVDITYRSLVTNTKYQTTRLRPQFGL